MKNNQSIQILEPVTISEFKDSQLEPLELRFEFYSLHLLSINSWTNHATLLENNT